MIRSKAREKAFMFLFQLELQKGDEDRQLTEFMTEREVSPAEAEYMVQLVNGVRAHYRDLDERFSPLLKRWTTDRLPKVDLTILRLATYEMFYQPNVPASVAISEAVLLSKKYSSEESRSYINAVLGRLSRSLEADAATKALPDGDLSAGEANPMTLAAGPGDDANASKPNVGPGDDANASKPNAGPAGEANSSKSDASPAGIAGPETAKPIRKRKAKHNDPAD